jgi:DNA-binding transcriptional LysR family regulator
MIRDIDIALLRAFLTVVETGGVTNASRILNRTQAAVSQQIKRLEELFGTELFLREHKRLTLAPAGERLLGEARKLVALNDDVWSRMTKPDFEGVVRLGVPMDIVSSYVPSILRRFNQAWPRVRVSLICENSHELLEGLANGTVDITLTTDSGVPVGPNLLRLDRLVWVGHANGDAHLRRPLPLSIGTRTCRFRSVVLDALRKTGLDWRFVLEVSNQDAVFATVAANIAVSAMLADSVPGHLQIPDERSGLPPLPEFQVNLFLPAGGANDIATELAAHIRQDFALRFGTPHAPRTLIAAE